ncbi:MarR family winged helix-turn-helix transcriptional regulator [Elstera cyanobacteriorum]|uniref:MarR family transcriptional regulator n=1 Tax=Elstera cyanobacteriorum TaxID=2022747 RepID=A0A255XVD7_9PROT|nr:MarR family winged helix-turn-helix transcriptional regulator [Elstera cyanobacteriorum]MCK6443732.1 MarR family winged helix-turn-helix transcriptional regulator [Elstera cyanobacteriorum]OYQ20936.1 MarR family transcriptional regulator [Elstera cyanobacteriorum]GFZ97601.1 transcriptional regulator [Elstera cyanobacteriorum]
MKAAYLEAIRLTERLHRQFLELIKSELDRLGIEDINNVQAFILFNIGSDDLTVGELTNRGYYLGSNVSYNVRKMVENGYLMQERSTHDRRSIRVKLSAKGLELCQIMDRMFDRQVAALGEVATEAELTSSANTFRRLERFWIGMLDYGLRS